MKKITLNKSHKQFVDYLNEDNFLQTYYEPFYITNRDNELYISCTFSAKSRKFIEGAYPGFGIIKKLPQTEKEFEALYKYLLDWCKDSAIFFFNQNLKGIMDNNF